MHIRSEPSHSPSRRTGVQHACATNKAREYTRHTGSCCERYAYPRPSWERSHLSPYKVTWRVIAALAKLSEDTFCYEGQQALGVESGIVKTHVLATHIQHVLVLEVLHGVLYPEVHNNGLKKKKKKKKKIVASGGQPTEQSQLLPNQTMHVVSLRPLDLNMFAPNSRSWVMHLGIVLRPIGP